MMILYVLAGAIVVTAALAAYRLGEYLIVSFRAFIGTDNEPYEPDCRLLSMLFLEDRQY